MMARLRQAALDALYPPDVACPLCNREATLGPLGLCDACADAVRACPLPAFREPLDGLAAAFLYDGPARDAIHRFKYGNATYLADFFAKHIPIPDDWKPDCLVPVPLYWLRQLRRGYNQSELLALALSERCAGLPVRTDLLRRTRHTRSQTQLSAAERQTNLRGAFRAFSAAKGLSILLVDDVATTRATLCACAAQLKRHGAKRVYAACACAVFE